MQEILYSKRQARVHTLLQSVDFRLYKDLSVFFSKVLIFGQNQTAKRAYLIAHMAID